MIFSIRGFATPSNLPGSRVCPAGDHPAWFLISNQKAGMIKKLPSFPPPPPPPPPGSVIIISHNDSTAPGRRAGGYKEEERGGLLINLPEAPGH